MYVTLASASLPAPIHIHGIIDTDSVVTGYIILVAGSSVVKMYASYVYETTNVYTQSRRLA